MTGRRRDPVRFAWPALALAGLGLLVGPSFMAGPRPPIVALAPLLGILFLAAGLSFALAGVLCSKKK